MPGAQEEFGRRAVQWVMRFEQHLVRPPGSSAELIGFLKRAGELAHLANLLLRERAAELDFCHHAEPTDLLERWWRELEEGALLHDTIVRTPRLASLAAVYVPFFQRGMRHDGISDLVAHAVRERPFSLALAATAEQLGVAPGSGFDRLVEGSWLYRASQPPSLGEVDAYTVAHIAFHLDDRRRMPKRLRTRLRRWTPAWVRQWARAGNLDLLAEMIMVAHCLSGRCVADADWGALFDHQGEDGAVPALTAETVDESACHSTIVGAMAAILCSRRERCDRSVSIT